MSGTKSVEIKCNHCDTWFPSPIFFGDINTFDMSQLEGNITNCPKCNKMTGCNKENIRLRSDVGGFRGSETF
jgi:hypothetical protein